MKIKNFHSEAFNYDQTIEIVIELENGNRQAVRCLLPADTEELPEAFREMGKLLRDWARQQFEAEES